MSTTSNPTVPLETRSSIFSNRRALTAGALLLLLLGGSLYLILTRGQVSTDDAQVDGRLVPIAPKIYGYISELLVNDNQGVTEGQVIARIAPRDEEVKVAQAEAALEMAEAQAFLLANPMCFKCSFMHRSKTACAACVRACRRPSMSSTNCV